MSRPVGNIRPYAAGDIEKLHADLRPADAAEIEALAGPGRTRATLLQSVEVSTLVWSHYLGDDLLSVFGVAPLNLLAGEGAVWLMGTRLLERHPSALVRQAPEYISRMRQVFPRLVNAVDARNTKSVRWLRRLGFTLLPARPMGAAGLPFHPFYLGF